MTDDLDGATSEEPTAPAWMATFGDLMSLLLTFFVLLMSFASMDVRRFAAVVGSMRDAFGSQQVHPGHLESLATSLVRLSDVESTPFLRVIDVPNRSSERNQDLADRLRMTVIGRRLERVVQVEETPRGLVLRVPGRLLFDPGSAALRPESLVFLREIADLVKEMPDEVAIEGHTDSLPGAAGQAANWDLSADRAIAALRFLVEVGGVDPRRLRATGYGATRPLAPNREPEERAQNRRVEFVFLNTAAAAPSLPARTDVGLSTEAFDLQDRGFTDASGRGTPAAAPGPPGGVDPQEKIPAAP